MGVGTGSRMEITNKELCFPMYFSVFQVLLTVLVRMLWAVSNGNHDSRWLFREAAGFSSSSRSPEGRGPQGSPTGQSGNVRKYLDSCLCLRHEQSQLLLAAAFLGADSCLLGGTEAPCFLAHDQRGDENQHGGRVQQPSVLRPYKLNTGTVIRELSCTKWPKAGFLTQFYTLHAIVSHSCS